MPDFRYESLTRSGEARSGVMAASDQAEAVRLLTARGESATSLRALEADGKARPAAGATAAPGAGTYLTTAEAWLPRRLTARATRPVPRRAEVANLVRELATAIEAGLPLMQSLRTVRRQAAGKAMPAILDHLIERVEAGDTLHQAAREYGRPFDDMIVGMLRAADASGEMSKVLHQLADLLERSLELRREVLGATFYPMIVAGLIVVSVIILVTVLVPRLIGPLAGEANFQIPWPTQVVLGAATLVQHFWYVCLLGLAAAWIGWRLWTNVPANRHRVDRVKLRLPLVGRLLRDVAVARFTRTLGTLVSAGLPILDALRITRDTLGNKALMQAIDEVGEQVTAGRALADPLERSGLFPPLLIQVVNLGERSGRLENMLLHAAGAFDRQVASSIQLFTKALPPLLLIVMASIGAFILAAIL
ncbi:MAG: type II secretion system F family protein, partial [Planctomycetota bacterium]